jgi:hypothetical protein
MRVVTRDVVRRDSERGFALLLVFLMAAAVALMLYRQLPRVAFETEREKEQVLIDRGEQYRRAVQLFYLANKKFPNTLDELEKFQDKRYLRRRYKDPITGKDEWRLIHSNGAFLTDSLVTKPPTAANGTTQVAGAANLTGNTAGTITPPGTTPNGQDPNQQPTEVNAAVLRRPSDRIGGGNGDFGQPPVQQQDENGVPRFDPNAPISLSAMQATQTASPAPGQPQFPGQQVVPGQGGTLPNQIPGLPPVPGSNPAPGQQLPQFRIDANGRFVPIEPQQQATATPNGVQQFRNQGSIPTPGAQGAGNPAINLINHLLTTPRQQPGGAPLPGGITPGGVGIAGVASTSTGASIKRYKDKGKYSEWEFVFDLAAQQQQQQQRPGQNGQTNPTGQPGQPAGPPGLFPATNPVTPAGNGIPRQ